MPWPNIQVDGTLLPFTPDQIEALDLDTADVRNGDHPTFELDSQGCSIRRMFFCDWAQRDNAIAYLLGASSVVDDGTDPTELSRIMPQSFPVTGYSQYVAIAVESCVGARSAGVSVGFDIAPVPTYDSAKLVVRYEQVFFGLASDADTTHEYDRYTERLPSTSDTSYLSLPGSMMEFRTSAGGVPNGYKIPYNTGKPETLTKVSWKWRRIPQAAWGPGTPLYKRVYGDPADNTIIPVPGVPAPPVGYGKIRGAPYIGTVNSSAFMGYPGGYLLFEGVDEEIVPDPVSGEYCWNLTLKFLVKAVQGGPPNAPEAYGGHNYLYYGGGTSTANNGYYLATKASLFVYPGHIYDGACLFNERNFENLFKVGTVPDNEV